VKSSMPSTIRRGFTSSTTSSYLQLRNVLLKGPGLRIIISGHVSDILINLNCGIGEEDK
jgi:hypothetical protein